METPENISTSLQQGSGPLQGCLLPYTNTDPIQEVPTFSHPVSVLAVQSTTFWPVHSSHGVHSNSEGGQTDPPAPRRLVGHSQIPPNLSPGYTDSSSYLSGVRLVSKPGKVRNETQTSLRLSWREGGQG